MGVDLMPFSINTARARFLRLGLEFFDSKSDIHRDVSKSAPCEGISCAINSFPIACVGSGLDMPWLQSNSFNKYISVYPINHFDDEGSEKLVSLHAVILRLQSSSDCYLNMMVIHVCRFVRRIGCSNLVVLHSSE
jgi:hypothetical protein